MRTCVLAALCAVSALAQGPAFEVATLRLSPPPPGDAININLGSLRGNQFTMTNVTLNDMVKAAYELVSDEQLRGPGWGKETRFDVVAQSAEPMSLQQAHLMLQRLLLERLKVVIRREQAVLPHLALVIGKGAKMPVARGGGPPVGPQVRGKIEHTNMSMALLVSLLSRFERQTIVDLTGLPGTYVVNLTWAPDTVSAPTPANAPPPDRPSLFAAVQEQLGLKLESRRGPLEVLVVEGASRTPEEN